MTDEYDKHPNEVVKNEELTYNNNGGFSLKRINRRSEVNSTSFLFSWMPQQLSFIVLTLSLVFFLNYLFVIHSVFAPNLIRVIRCKIPASTNAESETFELDNGTMKTSKICQLASNQCELMNVPRADVDDSNTIKMWAKPSLEESQQVHVSRLIQCCQTSRATATASVKLIDKAMPPQLIPHKRSIVTTNFNDNTSSKNILNNTNTILNYFKSSFVHSHLNRTYDEVNGPINFTNAFIALYTRNSDNNKLYTSSDKYSLDIKNRHNSIECNGDLQQQQQQDKHHYDKLNSRCSGKSSLVQCFR